MIDTQTDTATPSPASVSHCPVLPRSLDEALTGLSARDGRSGGIPAARIRARRGVRRFSCQAPSPCATLGATFNWLGRGRMPNALRLLVVESEQEVREILVQG